MSTSLEEQIKQLKQAIDELEDQRSILGDEAVEAALVPSRRRLAELESQVEQVEPVSVEPPTHQRKLATILFMDVVGSTELTRGLDPEDQMELFDPLIARLAEKITEFGGHVARFQGDGFKAVFGLPLARENDPEQAIRAGLAIQAEAADIAAELESQLDITGFKVRVGISTGLVFAGGETEGEDTIKGDPVNLAARLESAARPGELLISHDTYRHVRGVFNVDPLQPIAAKGFPEPVPVYLVRELKTAAFRVLTRGVEGVETRMVGRQAELKCLQDALLTAFEEGEGQVVTISGEAGVGKSRLLYEFQNWIDLLPATQAVFFFQGRGRQEAQGLPYSLLRDMFFFRFQILEGDTGQQARNKIESGISNVFGQDDQGLMRAHILGQILGFDFSASPHLKGVLNDAEQLRNRGRIYLMQYFQALSRENPIVVLLEDIHWGDDSSLNVVNIIGENSSQQRILIVCAARPTLFERYPDWSEEKINHAHLAIFPLSKSDSNQLLVEILKFVDLIPSDIHEMVISKSEGNPFYMEELVKMLIEDGVIIKGEVEWEVDTNRISKIDVPSTLTGVLQARLDSLPVHERTILQQASVVGRLFWDRIVAYIQVEGGDGGDPQQLSMMLRFLCSRELIYRHEETAFAGAVEYIFKHDVLREVTYESTLKRLRKKYHGLVADWLIDNSGDRIGEYSGLIGEHLLLAGRREHACEYFFQAGKSALASYANAEAENFFKKALELSHLDSLRAKILTGLGEALKMMGSNEEANRIWREAINYYQELGDSDHLGDLYARLISLVWHTGTHHQAWELCQEGLEYLNGEPDSSGYARLLAEAGRTAEFSDLEEQVVSLCQKALDMAEGLGDLEVWAECSNTLALNLSDTDDFLRGIDILKEIVRLTEAEGLLRSASRVHNNLAVFIGSSLAELKSIIFHQEQAVEIERQIGDIGLMIFTLNNLASSYIENGDIATLEYKLYGFLRGFTAAESVVNEVLKNSVVEVQSSMGNWEAALEATRTDLKSARERGNLQDISKNNLGLVNLLLELNRFENQADLSEGESALMENIEMERGTLRSYCQLAIVCARQRRTLQANDWLTCANELIGRIETDFIKSLLLEIDFEITFSEGQFMEAVVASEKLVEIFENNGYRWSWARKLIDLGDALIGRDDQDDLERARETYQWALKMFTEMSAPGYIRVLEERLAAPGQFLPGTGIGPR